MEWLIGIGLLIFACIFISGFFDTLIIQVLRKREVDRDVRVMIAAVVSIFIFLMAAVAYTAKVPREYRKRKRPAYEWPLIAMVFLTPAWCAAGIINRWPLTYIAGDVFLLSVFPITYFTLVRRPMDNPRAVFRWLYGMMLFMAILSTVLVLYHNMIMGYKHKMSVDAALPPTFYVMLQSHPAWWELALIPMFIIAAVLTSKRSTWAGLALVFCLAILMRPGIRRGFRMFFVFVAIAALTLIIKDERPEWIDHTKNLLVTRWEETQQDISSEKGDLSATAGGRMSEVYGVYDTYMERRSPVDWMTGLGLGAVVKARGGRTRHHIHSTPATFLARTGIVGLALWVIFATLVFLHLLRHARRNLDEWNRVQVCFWLGIWISGMIFSLKSQAFWGSTVGGMQLAYMYHLCRLSESSKQVEPVRRKQYKRREVGVVMRRRALAGTGMP